MCTYSFPERPDATLKFWYFAPKLDDLCDAYEQRNDGRCNRKPEMQDC